MQERKRMFFICLLVVCWGVISPGTDKIVWQENFDKPGTMKSNGWTPVKVSPRDNWKIKGGTLKALCAFQPYKGSCYTKEIPFINKGVLTFDVNINSNHAKNYKHLSLQFKFYNILTSFKGYKKNWMRLYKGKWRIMGKIPNAKWIKCKIVFDNTAGSAEYYIGDMANPTMVDTDIKFKPEKNGKGKLMLGNYGLANTTVLNEVDNIRLCKSTDSRVKSASISNTAMVFRGITYNYYQLDKIARALNITKFRNYTLITGLALHSKNNFHLDKKPPIKLQTMPRYIIMADMPLKKSVPDYVISMITKSVKQGAALLILGGMFTLNKGDFHNTPIAKILPVKLGSPWDLLDLKEPVKISNNLEGKPVVKYLHPLKLTAGAKVLASAGNHPFIVSGKYGKGKVIVCLGMPCGKFPAGEVPFWQWDKWPEFISNFTK
jgi:Putative glutamine amidotransferase